MCALYPFRFIQLQHSPHVHTLAPNTHLAASPRQVADTLLVHTHVYASTFVPIGNLSRLGCKLALAHVPVSCWWLHEGRADPQGYVSPPLIQDAVN